MTIEKTFARALRKTVKQGYRPVPGAMVVDVSIKLQTNTASYVSLVVVTDDKRKRLSLLVGLNDVIFDHEFARRLWGEELIDDGGVQMPAFKLHLKQLALLNSIKGRLSYIGSTM